MALLSSKGMSEAKRPSLALQVKTFRWDTFEKKVQALPIVTSRRLKTTWSSRNDEMR